MCKHCLFLKIKKLIKKENAKLMSQLSDSLDSVLAALTTANSALDNIVGSVANIAADETNLAKMIQDLKDQLANSGLSPQEKAAIQAVLDAANAQASKTTTIADQIKVLADSVPDIPPPPPPQS